MPHLVHMSHHHVIAKQCGHVAHCRQAPRHNNLACSGHVYARQLFQDLYSISTSTVGQVLSQPNPIRVAKFLTWVRNMRLNHAQSDE